MQALGTTEEKELLLQLKNGSNVAFGLLYQKYYGTLYLHAYNKLRDRDAAKDIVQDIFVQIWQKKESLEIKTTLASYLYIGTRNRILNFISKEKSKSDYFDSLSEYVEEHFETPEALLREKMLHEQIETALDSLPPRVKQVFELSRKSYLTYKEIASELNISEHTVRGYVKEALRILRLKFGSLLWILFVALVKCMTFFKLF